MRQSLIFTGLLLLVAGDVRGQISVQQPVVGATGVRTSVSVPDRGSTLLGGVSSANSFRQSYGPLRTGTSRGYDLSGGSMSAHVHIIDLQAMDEAILNSVAESPTPGAMRSRPMGSEREVKVDAPSPLEKAANFERLARQAEAAGKAGVAKLHWQMAARHGSKAAQEKLNASVVDRGKIAAQK